MNNLTKINKGIYLAFLTAIISGFAVFLNKFALSFWNNSSVYTTAKNLVTAIILISLILFLKKFSELKQLSRKQWLQLVLIGLIGGSIPFLLFFKGLSLTSAGTSAFIHKTLFIWVALLAIPFLKEKISLLQFTALGILFIGVYLFESPSNFKFGMAEFLILIATLLWAVENIIAKITLGTVSPLVVAWARMFFGSIFLLIYLAYVVGLDQLFVFSAGKMSWLLLTGFILFGYVITWYSALKFAPATVVAAILVVAAPITAFLNSIFVTHTLKNSLIFPVALIIISALIFSRLLEKLTFILKRKLLWTES